MGANLSKVIGLKILSDYSLDELKENLKDAVKEKYRIQQIFDCILHAKGYDESNLPKKLINDISSAYVLKPVNIYTRLESKDGTKKYLLQLNDGNIVECVWLTQNYGNTICLSTQVGCRMGCTFCASTLNGLVRNMSAGEMLSAVAVLNADNGECTKRNFSNIVLMGSGEPLDNYDNIIKFLSLVTDDRGFNLSERSISLSTCGIVPKIYDLMKLDLNINLCISLHASTDTMRKSIMPIANAYSLDELVTAIKAYAKHTGRRVILEYCLIKGVNDSVDDCKRLAKLFSDTLVHVNIINLNEKDDKQKAVSKKTIKDFIDNLNKLGISATLRRSQGNDIAGACGMLRAKYIEK